MARNVLNISIPENSEETTLFVSPLSSNGGLTPEGKPELNERLIKLRRPVGFVPPAGMFKKVNRQTVESRYRGHPPFFVNAKPAAMLEKGWIRSIEIRHGMQGLVTVDDGPSINVSVLSVKLSHNRIEYKMIDTDTGEQFVLTSKNRYSEWDFYVRTAPVPFVPRQGGSKKTRRSKKMSRRMRRKA